MKISGQELITAEQLLPLLLEEKVRIIDVRAPIEFQVGSIPFSLNLPILDNEERALVGTTYKEQGPEKAIALGHHFVSGETKSRRLAAWIEAIEKNPEHILLTCFRGGLRSQTAQRWLADHKIFVPRLAGGYKEMRQRLISETVSFSQNQSLLVLTGKTGSGKTQFLRENSFYPSIDLELLAHHRGSAFGGLRTQQPSQIDFENHLALQLSRRLVDQRKIPALVEDESRMIGINVIPEAFFHLMRRSSVLVLEEPIEVRIENTLQEYVMSRAEDPILFSDLQKSLEKIKSKLGGLRFSEISQDIRNAEKALHDHQDFSMSKIWIEKLLSWYYDPLYEKALAKRNPHVLARGNRNQIKDFIRQQGRA